MARGLTVHPHLPADEVKRRFLGAKEPVARGHWQVVMMALAGKSSREIVDATTLGRDWVFVILKRYNEGGPDALGDNRVRNGAAPLLDEAGQCDLAAALDAEPPEGGLWTGPKVAAWISRRLGKRIHPQRGWDYLRRLGFRLKVPRPRHAKADELAQDAFKKGASKLPSNGSNESTRRRAWRSGPRTKLVSA